MKKFVLATFLVASVGSVAALADQISWLRLRIRLRSQTQHRQRRQHQVRGSLHQKGFRSRAGE